MPEGRLVTMLRLLRQKDVEFILVGGLAAVLHGAPIQTYDVDIVYSREPANIDRLIAVLESVDAIFRIQPERRLRPTRSHLAASGHLNLLTRHGPLDLLATIGTNLGYAELLPDTTEMEIAEGLRIRVLNLESIISVKEHVGSEKDAAALPILRRTLQEIRTKSQT
jgi:predicted nucleotidyltransferase